jgi:uncharacterized membrane protein
MVNFKAVTFDGRKTAHRVLDALEELDTSYIWLEEGDVATISVNQKGHIKVHSTWAQDSTQVSGGIGFGALAGGLIGMLLGPGGALAGAAIGGSIGGLIGHHENVKFGDLELENFAESLAPDTSALVLLGPQSAIDEFTDELDTLEDYEYAAFVTELNEEAVDELRKAMKK